jgi:hypothetical protein
MQFFVDLPTKLTGRGGLDLDLRVVKVVSLGFCESYIILIGFGIN